MDSASVASSNVVTRWKVSSSSYEFLAMRFGRVQVSYRLRSNTQVSVDALQNITPVLRQCLAINIKKHGQ